MSFILRFLAFCLVLAFLNHSNVSAVRVQDYFEQTCSKDVGFVTESFENWAANLPAGTPLYFPMLAKLDLLRLTQDLWKSADLTGLSGTLIDHSCINVFVTTSPDFRLDFKGYCGKSFFKVLKNVGPKMFSWPKWFPKGVDGVFRVSLSDNKSWQVVDVCWGDGQRSFAVISSRPKLSSCEYEIIKAHLAAIGFKEEFFYGLNYDYCQNSCSVAL